MHNLVEQRLERIELQLELCHLKLDILLARARSDEDHKVRELTERLHATTQRLHHAIKSAIPTPPAN